MNADVNTFVKVNALVNPYLRALANYLVTAHVCGLVRALKKIIGVLLCKASWMLLCVPL